jgi:hypothetical protein
MTSLQDWRSCKSCANLVNPVEEISVIAMARGWESKSVEDQIAEAEQRKLAEAKPKLSAAELEQRERSANLQLARSRLREQLSRARSAAHQQMLERALAEIEAQLNDQLPSA